MRGDALVLLRDTGGGVFVQVEDQRTTGISLNDEMIDITNKDSGGWRELLAGGAIKTASISVEGVWTGSTNQQAIRDNLRAGTIEDFQIDDGVEVIEGGFQVTSFEMEGPHDGEQTYSATLESADLPTVT